MGNWNPNYFEKKPGSLEEAILNAVNGKINEAKVVMDLENDDPKLMRDIKKFGLKVKDLGDSGNEGYNEYEISGPQAKIDAANKKLKLMPEQKNLDKVNPKAAKKDFDDRKDKDIDNDGDVDSSDKYLHKRRKAISKAIKSEDADVNELSIADVKKATEKAKKRQEKERKATGKTSVSTADLGARKEAYEYGTKEATENSLNITPGQSTDDWNKQVGVMQEKQTSMREALAKMWGVEEGHNPFKKEEVKTSKKEGKTMTGKSETKVTIGMKDK